MKYVVHALCGASFLVACASTATLDLALPSADSGAHKRAFEIADLYRCATLGAPSLSPDGKHAAFSVKRYDLEAGKTWSELWLVDMAGGAARALTSGQKNDTDPQFAPDGRTLAFLSTRSGTSQVWSLPLEGGEATQVTSFGPGFGAFLWLPDGKRLVASADVFPECGADEACNKRIGDGLDGKLKVHVADDLLYRHWTSWSDGRRTHLFLVDARSGAVARDLTPGAFDAPPFSLGGRGFDVSPDGSELCFMSNRDIDQASSTNADLWTVALDTASAEPRALNVTDANDGWDGAPLYSPDGRWIAFISQATAGYESDLKRLAVFERATRTVHYLTQRGAFDDMVEDMRWKRDSSALVFQAEVRGRTPLFSIGVAGGTPRRELEHDLIAGWELARDGGGVVYAHRSTGEPTELFRAAFDGSAPRCLTTFNKGVADEVDLRPALEFTVQGAGNYRVHGFLVTPHGFDPSQRYPLILNVHGGPQSQWADAFRGDWQVYPGKGYIVAFCNPTGSTGYGQDFTDAITRNWGGAPFDDLMKITDALEQLPFVDKERMGVMGWSYGGYMAMWMQGHTERFKCNAAMMGLYDLPSFYGATEELWFPEHDLGGAPWTSAQYERWSPSNYVEHFATPALVITGELDYRVPYTQSLGYFTALKKRGVPARLVVFPGAGHWPAWHEMAFYYNAHLDFFHTYLGGAPAPWDVQAHSRNLHFEKSPIVN